MNPPVATQLALKITTQPCNSLCFAPDGNVFAHAAMDGAVPYFTIWDVNAARAMIRIDLPQPVFLRSFSADGQVLATTFVVSQTGYRNGFQLWHVLAGVELPAVPCDFLVSCMAFASNGLMAAGGVRVPDGLNDVSQLDTLPEAEGMIQVWPSVRGGSPVALVGHTHMVGRIAFAKNGRWLASCDIKGHVRIWDLQTGQPLAASDERTSLVEVTFVEDDQTLMLVGGETASTWRWAAGVPPETVRIVGGQATSGSSLLRDGCHLAASGRDHSFVLMNARTGLLAGEIYSVPVPQGQYPWFTSVAAANASRLAVSCAVGEAASITFFDLYLPPVAPSVANGLQLGEIARMTCHNPVVSVSLAPDGRSCVSAAQREVQVWTLPEGRRAQRVFLAEEARVVRHSPAGDRIAAVDVKGQVSLWQTPQLEPIARWDSGVEKPELLVFSPDGSLLAVADGGYENRHTLVVCETTTGRSIARFEDKKCLKHTAFLPMPGGWRLLRVLTNGSGHESRCVIEPLQGDGKKQRFTLAGDPGGTDSIYCMVALLLPGKGTLAAFDEVFNCVHFFDIASGKNLRNLPLGEVRVRALSASLDGAIVALAGGDMAFMKRQHDHSVHLIDTVNHHEFARLEGHTDIVHDVAVSESGEFVLSGSADLTLRLWKARP